jgi:hypothetical protein
LATQNWNAIERKSPAGDADTRRFSLPPADVIDRFLSYDTQYDRQLYHAMDQLERQQRQRRGENVPAASQHQSEKKGMTFFTKQSQEVLCFQVHTCPRKCGLELGTRRVAANLAPLLSLQLRAIETTDLERRVAGMEELLAKADKDSDSTNGGRGNVPTKPNGNWKDPIAPSSLIWLKRLSDRKGMRTRFLSATASRSVRPASLPFSSVPFPPPALSPPSVAHALCATNVLRRTQQ